MKTILLLGAALLCAVFADVTYNQTTCEYVQNGITYNFSNQRYFNLTDVAGNVWFVDPCPGGENRLPCPKGSSVCMYNNVTGKVSDRGNSSTVIFADSQNGGIEATYSSPESCGDGEYKTFVNFVCTSQLIIEDGCLTNIYIVMSEMCPAYNDGSDGGMPWEDNESYVHADLTLPFLVLLCIPACCLCLCCCCIRKRRCQRARQIQMQQMHSAAFQPIPSSSQPKNNATAPFNPYIAQPQYFYYYPNQNQQEMTEMVPLENIVVESEDEKLAKQLQAQYDREAQM